MSSISAGWGRSSRRHVASFSSADCRAVIQRPAASRRACCFSTAEIVGRSSEMETEPSGRERSSGLIAKEPSSVDTLAR